MTTEGRLYYEFSGEGEVYLYFAYDPTVIEAIKFAVPSGHRRWSPDHRRWVVSEPYWPRLRKTLIEYGLFDSSEFAEHRRRARSGPSVTNGGGDWAVLHLTPDAPEEVVKAAYRALAKMYHPDWGDGTQTDRETRTRKLARINVAYETLLERVKK